MSHKFKKRCRSGAFIPTSWKWLSLMSEERDEEKWIVLIWVLLQTETKTRLTSFIGQETWWGYGERDRKGRKANKVYINLRVTTMGYWGSISLGTLWGATENMPPNWFSKERRIWDIDSLTPTSDWGLAFGHCTSGPFWIALWTGWASSLPLEGAFLHKRQEQSSQHAPEPSPRYARGLRHWSQRCERH